MWAAKTRSTFCCLVSNHKLTAIHCFISVYSRVYVCGVFSSVAICAVERNAKALFAYIINGATTLLLFRVDINVGHYFVFLG